MLIRHITTQDGNLFSNSMMDEILAPTLKLNLKEKSVFTIKLVLSDYLPLYFPPIITIWLLPTSPSSMSSTLVEDVLSTMDIF